MKLDNKIAVVTGAGGVLCSAFARELAPILKSDNEDDRETAKRALQLGLQAMKKTR